MRPPLQASGQVRGPTAARPPARAPLVGGSDAIRALMETVARAAAAPRTTVLIAGESGVGKELVARAVHDLSPRASGPFVALNCAALSDSLLEAELFGYEPGAFTGGAPRGREGLLAAAEGGTVLFDEVGELAPGLQAKLLRVLQERCYRRVGGRADLSMDARIVASTNRDLAALVAAGGFREDLFYRLNVMSLRVPPLRARAEDVLPLAEHFLAQIAAELGRDFAGLAPGARERLAAHAWPGNVRELRNAVERAALLSPGPWIEEQHLGLPSAAPGRLPDPLPQQPQPSGRWIPMGDGSLRGVEEALIRRVLAETRGNRTRAAAVLGINRTTLYHKLRLFRIGEAREPCA